MTKKKFLEKTRIVPGRHGRGKRGLENSATKWGGRELRGKEGS